MNQNFTTIVFILTQTYALEAKTFPVHGGVASKASSLRCQEVDLSQLNAKEGKEVGGRLTQFVSATPCLLPPSSCHTFILSNFVCYLLSPPPRKGAKKSWSLFGGDKDDEES